MKKLLLLIGCVLMFSGCADKGVRTVYKGVKTIHRALPVQSERLKTIGSGVEAIDSVIVKGK